MGVKFFHSGMSAAPTLNGLAGSMVAVLNACLADGFGSKSVVSLVIAGGVATATVSGGHTFEPNIVAKVAGATVTGGVINGEQRVTLTGLNTISWATALADQTATGTITIEVAPLGWTKVAGTNKSAYQSNAVGATGNWLRVDDTGDKNARVRGYRTMSDVDTGTGPFPTDGQLSGGAYWRKGNGTSDSATKTWAVYGDERSFIFVSGFFNSTYQAVYEFGDFLSPRTGDPTACHLTAANNNEHMNSGTEGSLHIHSQFATGSWAAQSYSGIGGSVATHRMPSSHYVGQSAASYSGYNSSSSSYPNATDNGILLAKVCIAEASNYAYRGDIAGAVWVTSNLTGGSINDGDIIDGVGPFAGRKLRAIRCGHASNSWVGSLLVDITGPWR